MNYGTLLFKNTDLESFKSLQHVIKWGDEILDFSKPNNQKYNQYSLEQDLYLTRQLVLCKYGVLRGSNCCSAYKPENSLYLTRCCCINCANSIWIGDEKSAMNPFAALKGDPVYAIEVVREESPDETCKKARI